MRQQIDLHATFDQDVEKSDLFGLKETLAVSLDCIAFDINGELVEFKVYEECDIVGTSPACEELKEALGEALDWIAILTADDSEEFQDHQRWACLQSVYARHTLISKD